VLLVGFAASRLGRRPIRRRRVAVRMNRLPVARRITHASLYRFFMRLRNLLMQPCRLVVPVSGTPMGNRGAYVCFVGALSCRSRVILGNPLAVL
jgi:hypothetical protein